MNRSSDWAHWVSLEGKIQDKTNADRGSDFFNRYAEDIAICRQLNLNAFRLSLNWPALCPNPPVDGVTAPLEPDTLKFYRDVLEGLKREGMQTFVTLFHFTLPRWLADRGGWSNPEAAVHFESFAAQVADELGDLVDYWVTINEPLVYVYQSYVTGAWPPGSVGDYLSAFKGVRNLLDGHARAYRVIHEHTKNAKVSFTLHWRPFVPRQRSNPLDKLTTYYRDYVFNQLFPRAAQTGVLSFPFPISANVHVKQISGPIEGLKGTMDYLAINYYTRDLTEFVYSWPVDPFGRTSKPELEINCMGWESYPEGLFKTLVQDLKPYKFSADGSTRPIFITENGYATTFSADLADGDWSLVDDMRIEYLTSHLMALHEAIAAGANVKGYIYWSLVDNFEWSEGLSPRFGLVRVAYPTMTRTLRESAKFYAEIAKHNGISSLNGAG